MAGRAMFSATASSTDMNTPDITMARAMYLPLTASTPTILSCREREGRVKYDIAPSPGLCEPRTCVTPPSSRQSTRKPECKGVTLDDSCSRTVPFGTLAIDVLRSEEDRVRRSTSAARPSLTCSASASGSCASAGQVQELGGSRAFGTALEGHAHVRVGSTRT